MDLAPSSRASDDVDVESKSAAQETQDARPSWRQLATLTACLCSNVLVGALNGYDICITTVILDGIDEDLSLCGHSDPNIVEVTSCPAKQAVMSLSACGALLGRVCLSWVADRFGRRLALGLVDIIIVLGVILQWTSHGVAQFFVGRVLLGTGIGLAFVAAPTYLAEVAPQKRRGCFIILHEVAVCVGCLLGLEVATEATQVSGRGAWRKVIALALLPAVLQFIIIFTLPESPRWYAMRGDCQGLVDAGARLGLGASELAELSVIAQNNASVRVVSAGSDRLAFANKSIVFACLRSQLVAWKDHRRAFLLALGVASCVSAAGNLAMQAYAFDLLALLAVDNPVALLPLIGWMKLCGALVAMLSADAPWLGRRRLAMFGSLLCAFCDALLACALALPQGFAPSLAAVAFMSRIFAWNAGYGGIQFVASMEILPNEVRSIAAGQIFSIVGIIDIVILQLFETILLANHAALFIGFTLVNGAAFVFALFFLPDLTGLTLEVSAQATGGDLPLSPSNKSATIRTTDNTSTARTFRGSRNKTLGPRRYGTLTEDESIEELHLASLQASSAHARATSSLEPEVVKCGYSLE